MPTSQSKHSTRDKQIRENEICSREYNDLLSRMHLMPSALCPHPSLLLVCLFLCLSICPFVRLPVCLSSGLPLWHLPNSNSAHRSLQQHERAGQVAAVNISPRRGGGVLVLLRSGSEYCPPAKRSGLLNGSAARIRSVLCITAALGLPRWGKIHACLSFDTQTVFRRSAFTKA